MEEHIRRLGKQAALEANIVGLHEKLIEFLGRLKFRTSYTQNVLQHSLEVALPDRPDGRGARPGRRRWAAAAACCTTSARRRTTRWKAATRRSAPS